MWPVFSPRLRPMVAALVACTVVCAAVLWAPATGADAYSGPVESANARYVVASYRNLLGRNPDTAALNAQLNRLASGGDTNREAMARSLLFSPEAAAREVDRAYRAILHRSSEPGGRSYWTRHLQRHDVLDLRVLLFSSDEYRNQQGGTNRAWVRALYTDILGRRPDNAGVNYWVARADRGTPRALIVSSFYVGRESLGNRTDEYYRLVLRRKATAAERNRGASLIAAAGERALYARLWASDEAFERFFDAGWGQR